MYVYYIYIYICIRIEVKSQSKEKVSLITKQKHKHKKKTFNTKIMCLSITQQRSDYMPHLALYNIYLTFLTKNYVNN